MLRVGTKSHIDIEKDRSHRSCLVLTHYYTCRGKEPHLETLKIQSKHIIEALKDVIGSYTGQNFHETTVYISAPLKCFFHYRKELRAYAEKSDNIREGSYISVFEECEEDNE